MYIFGILLDEEQYSKLLNKEHDFFLGTSKPFENCDLIDQRFFISVFQPSERDFYLKEIRDFSKTWQKTRFEQFLKENNIPFQEPKYYSLPNYYMF